VKLDAGISGHIAEGYTIPILHVLKNRLSGTAMPGDEKSTFGRVTTNVLIQRK